ncbi:MAG: hypothetical protein IJT49_03935 [Clostridia bacterium]|nr:hypothetical protein [Clostridia bacterium]
MLSELFNNDYSPDFAKSVPVIIICLFIGVVAAAAISLYHKHVLGSFIRFLRSSGACDENTAIRLDTTKFGNNVFVKTAIKNGRTYACVLRSVLPEGATDPEDLPPKEKRRAKKLLLTQSGYYIPEELSFRADNIFSKRGTSVFSALFGILLFLIVAAVSLLIVPDIVELFKNWTGLQ